MITIIRTILEFKGGEGLVLLVASLLCCAAFLGLYSSLKQNRTKDRLQLGLILTLIALELTDVLWYFYFYPEGEYINHGVGGGIKAMFILPFWLGVLMGGASILQKGPGMRDTE